MSDETKHVIECPGHGPMYRFIYDGVLARLYCRTCGKQPIDLLENITPQQASIPTAHTVETP